MFITDWLRVGVEGDTVDGRQLVGQQFAEMASSYNPEVYPAKIWMEHLRGVLPDSVFKSLGSVVAVKAETIKGGDLDGKAALYVKLEPTTELIAMVRNGQKTHLSAEIHPAFPTTGGAYLMGVGVTDSPASLGTGIMKFSTTARPENVFSSPLSCELGNCTEGNPNDLQVIRALLEQLTANNPDPWKGKFQPDPTNPPQRFTHQSDFDQLKQAVEVLKADFEAFMATDITPQRPELGSYIPAHQRDKHIGY